MGFTGDSIVIKDDYSFERMENLNMGDVILGPEGPAIIVKISEEYKDSAYSIKTKNFLEYFIDEDTEILASKWFNLFNKETSKFETYLKPSEYLKIKDISPTTLLCLNNLPLLENNSFTNPILYGLLLNKAYLNKKSETEINIIAKNIQKYSKLIKNSDDSLYIQSEKNLTFINNPRYDWVKDLDCKDYQRKINERMFLANKDIIKNFLITFTKSNTDIFLKEDEFRLYVESKILAIQLFYLYSCIYNQTPIIEKVDKKTVEYKKIVQANRKKHFAVTMMPEEKTLKKVDLFYQEIDKINLVNKRLKIYNIEVLYDKPYYVNNIIVGKKEI